MKKIAVLAAAGLLAGSAFSGAVAQETIKIGVTQPLTGAFAASGNYEAQKSLRMKSIRPAAYLESRSS
jgi:ABC-type sugar transport system substrate-binding protein